MGKICVSFLICEQKKGFLLSTSARMPLCSRSFLEVQLEFKISSVNGKPSTLGRYFFLKLIRTFICKECHLAQ